jgi:hypothetical protein
MTKKKGTHMKSILLSIVCALAAPLAFAQVSTTTTEQTTTQPVTTTETTTTYATGTVSTYEPGKTIVVKSDEGPVSFALGTAARVVDGAGNVVNAEIRPGERVRVYYSGTGDTRVVERVVVEQPTTTTETTTTYATGTVSTYKPGKTIVVKSDEGPVSFALGTAAHIVNGAGKVVSSALRPGQHVLVYYTGPTEHRTVERVVVED